MRAAILLALPLTAGVPSDSPPPAVLRLEVVAIHPHDPGAFTQGLVWSNGRLFESTGLVGRSSLREVELESGTVLRQVDLNPPLFGEGLALVGDELVQLTWQDQRALRWRTTTFAPLGEFRYEGEGWGLCFDGTSLISSDGTNRLAVRDPKTFAVKRSVAVTDRGRPLHSLNELECVDGSVWANVYGTERIVRIDPGSGRVTGEVDASGLLRREEAARADVLNGIAWVPERGTFLLTGKLWPSIFEVRLVERR
jgi:glutaminyl-peptide cyclotransferase